MGRVTGTDKDHFCPGDIVWIVHDMNDHISQVLNCVIHAVTVDRTEKEITYQVKSSNGGNFNVTTSQLYCSYTLVLEVAIGNNELITFSRGKT